MDDDDLVALLCKGDEDAFGVLVDRYQMVMIRLALSFVPSRAVAEEVVQDTWLAVLRGLDRFEGRSSLKTWIFAILVNQARKTGGRERRELTFEPRDGSGIDAEAFAPDGAWRSPVTPWPEAVVERLFASAVAGPLLAAIAELPPSQRQVVTLRDVEGLSSSEVCTILGVSEGNQRVLLHRARNKLRGIVARELEGR